MALKKTFIHITLLALTLLLSAFQSAEDSVKHLLSKAKGTEKADILNQFSWEIRKQDPAKAIDYAQQALKQSTQENYLQGQAFANKNLGAIYWIKSQYKTAGQYLQQSLMQFKELGNQEQTANIYNLFGLNYADRGEYQRAIDMYTKAKNIYSSIKDADGEAIAICNLGIVYYGLGDYNKAFEFYHNGLRLYEKLGNKPAMANTYNNIGLIYSEQQRYDQARHYYRLSMKIDEEQHNLKGLIASYNNLGNCYNHEHRPDSSLYYHLKALNLAAKLDDQRSYTHALNNIGEIALQKNEYKKADSCFRLAYTIKTEIGDRLGQVIVLLNQGRLNYTLTQYAGAQGFYKQCLDLAIELGSLKYMKEASLGLSEVYQEMGDEKNAFAYYRRYQEYKDSLLNESTNNKIFSIETIYKTEKQEREKELLRKEKIIERNRKMSYAMGAGFILLLAAILVAWQILKTRREKILRRIENEKNQLQQKALKLEIDQRERELEHNRNELVTYTQSLLEKNKLLEELRENLEGFDLSVDQLKEKNRLEKINELTHARIVTEDDWTQFKKLFDKVFPGFFNKLKETYPGITTAEMRLAALIKLNLSGKEIAIMTGVSAESVKKTRQRIRKKMEMQQEDDLEKLIHSI